MSNATQYQFELVEIAKLLLRKQQIKDGLWTIGVAFNVGAMLAGPEPDKVRPSMMVSIERLVLTKTDDLTPLTVDASKLEAE